MSGQQIIFKNARMVLPTEVVYGSLSSVDGRIDAFDCGSNGVNGTGATVDLEGDYLLPGLVEMHTDNFERHLMPRPKVHWAEMPALLAHDAEIAAAGITTVFDALGVGEADSESLRGTAWDAVVRTIDTCADQGLLRADHYLHVRCELPAPNTVELFTPFREHKRLSLISLMDHTPGQRQWEDIEQARTYYTGKKGWSKEKFEYQVAQATMLQEKYAEPHRAYFVDYCREHGIALASHDDTTIEHVEKAHAEGATMSEFPTTMVAARKARERGLATVMGGPNVVRGGSHSGNVAAADLAREGLLDILSSDYVPGSLLSAVMRLVNDEILSLPSAVATISSAPAKATGLHDRGAIAPGLRADLVQMRVVDLPNGAQQAIVRAVWREGQRVI
jgi:alpha-D-ribose 1-methylphosphonate 5-triphosphate diphosphatase